MVYYRTRLRSHESFQQQGRIRKVYEAIKSSDLLQGSDERSFNENVFYTQTTALENVISIDGLMYGAEPTMEPELNVCYRPCLI